MQTDRQRDGDERHGRSGCRSQRRGALTRDQINMRGRQFGDKFTEARRGIEVKQPTHERIFVTAVGRRSRTKQIKPDTIDVLLVMAAQQKNK
jgi:hypothetical protein